MIPTRNGGGLQDDSEGSFTSNGTTDVFKANADGTLHISTSRKGLLGDGSPHRENYKKLTFLPKKFKLMQFNPCGSLGSPSSKFRQIAEEREGGSRSVPSSTILGFRKRFNGIVVQKIDWVSIRKICGQWIKNPLNMALLLWISCVAVSGGILFLVLTGMLNSVLPKKSQRNAWFEVNNQILNALFTLMCLYQHPKRFYHLVLLCRWKPKDITTLREVYCKNGTYKPREWAHMMVVVVLLHVNCFAQYALCVP
ncbi:PLAC8 family protein [Quillaja saponaria]|uniref:PLAC8 family protein n=1 Tax=Quillaja saponaria TaxID=32244 RepID=A0AAD7LN51_QUISA|nr:PLAC8 family protein [Quillaja saponaria]